MGKLLTGLAVACFVTSSASAAPVHVVFSGTVSYITRDNDLPLDPSVDAGTRFTGSIVYDDASQPAFFSPEQLGHEGPEPEFSQYDLTTTGSASYQIGTYSVVSDPSRFLVMDVGDHELYPGPSSIDLLWQSSGAGTPFASLGVVISIASADSDSPLHGTALPGIPWDVANFPQAYASFSFADENGRAINAESAIDYLAVVPEPEGLVLGSLVLLALALGFAADRRLSR
jgi:hypothetical protein